MRWAIVGLVAAAIAGLLGCQDDPRSEKGFRLPDGDETKGKQVFVNLKCFRCHVVSGIETPKPEEDIQVVGLGGEVRKVRTYGQLVTAVINPSHTLAKGYNLEKISEDGKSKMPLFNDVMTVTELSNLVAFLQSRYEIKRYEPAYEDYYPMP